MNVQSWLTLGLAPTTYTVVPCPPSGSANQDPAPAAPEATSVSTLSPPPPPIGQATEI